jgi:putative Holliday junction resolvase
MATAGRASPPPTSGAALALDLGQRKCGLARCDALRITTRALPVLRLGCGDPRLLAAVLDEVRESNPVAAVIGLPLRQDGSEGERAAPARAFAETLARACPGLAVLLLDESLTSKAADERMHRAGLARSERAQWRDSYAALVLLEDWLEDGGRRGERVAAPALDSSAPGGLASGPDAPRPGPRR